MNLSNQADHPLKNSLYSTIGYIFPIVFFILITPILVARLGLENYGVYILINTVLLFAALFDFGISSAFIKYISEAQAQKDEGKINRLSATANLIFFLVGLLGLAIAIAAGFLLSSTSNAADPDYFRLCFALAGISFIFVSLSTPFQLIPRACLKFNIEAIISIIQISAFNLGVLLLVWNNYGLKEILIWQIAVNILLWLVYGLTAKSLLGAISLTPGWDQTAGQKLWRFGFKTFISNVASMITNQLDRLVIPIFLGASALPYYALPGNITTQTGGITNALTSLLFPLSSKLQTETKNEQIAKIYLRAFRLIAVLASAITLAIIIFRVKILYFWLGGDFYARSAGLMLLLAAVDFILALGKPAVSVLLGLGKNKFLAVISSLSALLNLLLLLALIPLWGLTGAAIAFIIAVLPTLIPIWFLETRVLKIAHFWRRQASLIVRITLVSLLFWPMAQFLLLPMTQNILAVVIIGPLSVLIFLLIYRLLGFFEKEDTNSIKDFLRSYGQKL